MLKKLAITAMIVVYCSLGQMFASAGLLDPSFDPFGTPPGTVFTQIGDPAGIYGIAIQPDGKIIATGNGFTDTSEFALARYNTDGTLDNTFGSGGTVTTPALIIGHAVVIQPDGKIVVAGLDDSGSPSKFMVARFMPDGSLDTSFNGSGINITPLGDPNNSVANAVALQPDGKIVAVGSAFVGGLRQFVVARYTAAGILDPSFNVVGYTLTPVGVNDSQAFGVALQSDGNIVVAGQAQDGLNQTVAVARYTTAGVLDAAFGVGGIQKTSVGTNDSGNAIAIQPDGNIVVAGTATLGTQDFLIQRYTTAGVLDATFGSAGSVTTPIGGNAVANAVVIQQNGKIVAAGYGPFLDFALARYTTDGVLDPSFDTDGTVSTPLGIRAQVRSMALQSDGKIVVGGFVIVPGGEFGVTEFALARYFGDPTTSNTCAVRLINKYGTRLIAQD